MCGVVGGGGGGGAQLSVAYPSRCVLLGRAWLYIALNEQAMESYIRMFIENQDIAQDYYLRSAQLDCVAVVCVCGVCVCVCVCANAC